MWLDVGAQICPVKYQLRHVLGHTAGFTLLWYMLMYACSVGTAVLAHDLFRLK